MRKIVLALSLLAVAGEAQAISRYTSTAMSCAQVQAVIRDEGAVILKSQSARVPGLQLSDRYVREWSFCESHETAIVDFVRTADRRSCPVKECEPRSNDGDIFIRR